MTPKRLQKEVGGNVQWQVLKQAGPSPEYMMVKERRHMFSPKAPDEFFFSLIIPQSAPFMDDLTTSLLLFNVFIIFSNSTKFYLF